jgi:NADH dehydrogenase
VSTPPHPPRIVIVGGGFGGFYTARTLGMFVDPGRNTAVASMLGLPARLVTRTYHLSRIPGMRRKVRVAADWTIRLFFRRDTAELGALGHPKRLDE